MNKFSNQGSKIDIEKIKNNKGNHNVVSNDTTKNNNNISEEFKPPQNDIFDFGIGTNTNTNNTNAINNDIKDSNDIFSSLVSGNTETNNNIISNNSNSNEPFDFFGNHQSGPNKISDNTNMISNPSLTSTKNEINFDFFTVGENKNIEKKEKEKEKEINDKFSDLAIKDSINIIMNNTTKTNVKDVKELNNSTNINTNDTKLGIKKSNKNVKLKTNELGGFDPFGGDAILSTKSNNDNKINNAFDFLSSANTNDDKKLELNNDIFGIANTSNANNTITTNTIDNIISNDIFSLDFSSNTNITNSKNIEFPSSSSYINNANSELKSQTQFHDSQAVSEIKLTADDIINFSTSTNKNNSSNFDYIEYKKKQEINFDALLNNGNDNKDKKNKGLEDLFSYANTKTKNN